MNNEKEETIIVKRVDADDKTLYYVHHAEHYEGSDLRINIHTHGLLYKAGRLDLQIVLPIATSSKVEEVENILTDIANDIIYNGTAYLDGDKIITPYGVTLTCKLVRDIYSRTLLRLIYADPSGKFPWDDGVDINYKKQFTDADADMNKYILSIDK
jgi:hypothetical protein